MIETSYAVMFLHYPFWKGLSFSDEGVADDERVLQEAQDVWMNIFPEIPLTISCG
jgi:hypothetical protein